MTNIAVAPTPTTIVFGTDGWRAKIADDYTFDNVRRCADGVARYVLDRGEQANALEKRSPDHSARDGRSVATTAVVHSP